MKELVDVIARALVEKPEAVEVSEEADGKHVTVKLKVDPADMGKVIGKQGRIAKAIRTLVKAASTKDDLYVDVDIVE